MDPLILSLISACTALVASIAGPVVTLMVAKRQFSANVLSANRQKWIDALREALADIQLITRLAQKILKREWQRVKRGI